MNIFSLTILFPLLSFFILVMTNKKCSQNVSTIIGISGSGLLVLVTIFILFNVYNYSYNYNNFELIQELCSWFKIDDLNIKIMFRLDKLSLLMLSIISGIGFIVHIYSIWYMDGNLGYFRFFAYTNLFIANMILLVLSDNLLLIYFGWEGVGLCSYLLIGFYYFDPRNGIKAFKTFIMTRFGDIFLICSLFMIYDQYHTLSLNELLKLDLQDLSNNMSIWISIALLVGSIGKSAQLPFHSWLVSAMVGPTPVSALIHTATMVISGIYFINRMHNFFIITPFCLYTMGIIGAVTLIISSCSALFQNNIKKILAYSTVSQIGYMFLALSEKNWDGSMYHVMTHAFFKSLLFLAAGSLIRACKNEQNIFKMGVFYKSMPFIYICFVVGGASLSGFPMITAGFYSKELILLDMFNNHHYYCLFLGLIGMFLTSVYIFRMIFIIFHGKQLINLRINFNIFQHIPLIILLLLSTAIGSKISTFFIDSFSNTYVCSYNKMYFIITTEVVMLLGIWISYIFWFNFDSHLRYSEISRDHSSKKITRYLVLLCHYGWGFDWLYKMIFIKPYLFISKKLFYYNIDLIEIGINIFASFIMWLGRYLMYTENGKLNWYIVSVNIGAIIILLTVFMNLYV